MKKLTVAFTAVLCLLLLTVFFVSCGKTPVAAHDHVWDEGTVVERGDCKNGVEGSIRYTCTICGETKTESGLIHDWEEKSSIAAATCTHTGSTLYKCAKCGEQKAMETPIVPTAHKYRPDDKGRIITPPTETAEGKKGKICTECGNEIAYATVTYAEYITEVNALMTQVNSFSTSSFGGATVTTNLGTKYPAPSVSPTKGQHPRVLINQNDLAGIRAEITNKRSSKTVQQYLAYIQKPTTGQLGAKVTHGSDTDNYSTDTLYNIQALALEYQLTGNKIAGYQAVLALKNYILTLDIEKIEVDQERNYGYVMYIAACVYDWCYDLMTQTDRLQIVSGVEHKIVSGSNSYGAKMEIGFPPSKQGAISGHGTEFQLLRDYLAFAIAIYDEYPGWWNYIGGRFYSEFVPVRNEFYKAGMYPQGVSLYVRVRYAADLYSAWLIKAMTGSIPYEDPAAMKQVMRTIYSYELPKNHAFASGDDHADDDEFQDYGRLALISSYLFDDAAIRAELEAHEKSYTKFTETITMSASVSEYLICSSNGVAASKRHEDMPLIVYNGGWLGQIIARNGWGDDQAAVLMKIGVRTTSNHDHADAGQFQIWYKTMLAGDTGVYDTYDRGGSKDPHFFSYHQATVAHNSILIGSAGQKQPGETGSFSDWQSDTYKTGTVTGYAFGYADQAETQPTYAYIAGNITPAYGSAASEVTRRMLAVYDTKNEDVPLFFFVFDNIKTSSTTKAKTFLLHVPSAPTISGKTVTVQKDGAKLVLQSVLGGDNITSLGGANKNYLVNGVQKVPSRGSDDGYWGRVEISPNTGNQTDQLLNVMYVCDSGKTPANVTATAISTDDVKGAAIGNVAAVFVTSATRRSTAFSFSVTRTGEVTYYVSGVRAGKWTVSIGSSFSETVTATPDGGLLVFTAPAGTTLTLTPAQ